MAAFLNPTEILGQIELREDMVAADFGCGSGGWTIPLAKILKEGKVYAIDILEEPLSVLRAKIQTERIFNIEIRKANLEKGTTLLSNSCDLVLVVNLLFECENKKATLAEGKRVLKPEGKILVVDWERDNPLTLEIEFCSIEEIKKIVEELDLKVEKEFKAGSYHWGLILTK